MPTLTIEYRDEPTVALEQAIAYVADLRRLAVDAPAGTVLEACEASRWKGPRPAPLDPRGRLAEPHRSGRAKRGDARLCPEAHPGRSKGPHRRAVLTALGPVPLVRRYFACPPCDQGDFGAERVLGVTGYVTRGACRMACLLGVQRRSRRPRWPCTRWPAGTSTIIPSASSATPRPRRPRARDERDTAEAFAQASGDFELHIDAGKVNTQGGWRDVKVARRRRPPAGRADHRHGVGRSGPAGPGGALGGGRGGGGRGVRSAVRGPRPRGWGSATPRSQRAGRRGGVDLEPGGGTSRDVAGLDVWHAAGTSRTGPKGHWGRAAPRSRAGRGGSGCWRTATPA